MLAFIDESGDTGLRIEEGSTRYFVVSLVLFEDLEEATACDQRIQLLKKELGFPPDFEFHFYDNSDKVRRKFLEVISPYTFFYIGIAINKDPKKLWGEGFKHKDSFYKYVCGLVFENAKPHLKQARVKIDKSGSSVFRSQLAKYLQKKVNGTDFQCIKSVKMEHSHSNNLLQVADYVSGIINRKVQEKKNSQIYYKYISPKELDLRTWPK